MNKTNIATTMSKPRYPINERVSIALLCVYVFTYLLDFFTGQQILLLPFIMCIGTLTLLFTLFRRVEPIYYLSAVTFACFALFFGTMLHFYALIPIYDLLLHFSSGTLLVFAGHLFYKFISKDKGDIPVIALTAFCTLFAIAAAAVWEIWEYSGDVFFGLSSQGSGIHDTMTDIVAGSVGALIGGTITYLRLKKHS